MDSKRPYVLVALIAVVSASFAGVLYGQLASRSSGGRRDGGVVRIAVASQDLVPGTRITTDLAGAAFAQRDWPRDLAPRDVVEDASSTVGQIVREPIYAGEPLYSFKLASPDSGAALPAAIGNGMRALTVPVDEVSGVGGYVNAGAYVDVIGTFRNVRDAMFGHGRGETFSKVILEHVKVLASGTQMEQNDAASRAKAASSAAGRAALLSSTKGAPSTATLLVTPAQSESLALAVKEGSIHLALRNYDDEGSGQTTGITKEELLGLAEPEPVYEPHGHAAPPQTGPTVEVIRGSDRSSVNF